MFRKCYRHGINMTAVLQASRASRNALYQNAPYDRFVTHLNHIQESSTRRIYPEWMVILAIGLASSAFCLIFGGHAVEALYTMLAAMAGAWCAISAAGWNSMCMSPLQPPLLLLQ